jgi:hypothetical protein
MLWDLVELVKKNGAELRVMVLEYGKGDSLRQPTSDDLWLIPKHRTSSSGCLSFTAQAGGGLDPIPAEFGLAAVPGDCLPFPGFNRQLEWKN